MTMTNILHVHASITTDYLNTFYSLYNSEHDDGFITELMFSYRL